MTYCGRHRTVHCFDTGFLVEITSEAYRGADKSFARPTSRCILFDGQNISCDVSLVVYRVGQK
jgi:hypothetical protein